MSDEDLIQRLRDMLEHVRLEHGIAIGESADRLERLAAEVESLKERCKIHVNTVLQLQADLAAAREWEPAAILIDQNGRCEAFESMADYEDMPWDGRSSLIVTTWTWRPATTPAKPSEGER
jgi:hypothetical protein